MRTLVAFLTLTLLLITVEAESDPGVTDNAVKVGMIADLTGPLAFYGQQMREGAKLYIEHINRQGGVYGRKIDLIVEDDGYQPPKTIAAFRKLVDRDRVFCFVGNLGSATTIATFPFIEREKIPLVASGNFNSIMFTPPKRYVFALDPAYPAQLWIILKYIQQTQKETRLAVIYQDDDMGRDGLKGLREASQYYNMPVVVEDSYKRGAVDFSTQVLNTKQGNPTHVILLTVYREAAAILKKSHQLDWHPQFIGFGPAVDDKVVELAGEAAEGYMALTFLDFNTDNPSPQLKFYFDLSKRYTPDVQPRPIHAFGFAVTQILVEGLKRAGRDLTREKLVEALETFNGWANYLGAPLTYGPNIRGGTRTAAFLVKADIERRIMVRTTDWIEYRKPAEVE